MNSSDKLTETDVAFAGVQLFGNATSGKQPDWQEIFDWQEGLLDEQRATEVLSHVANNPECFQQWQDICEAQQWAEQESAVQENTEHESAEQTSVSAEQQRAESSTQGKTDSSNPAAWDLVGWISKGAKSIFSAPLPALGGAVAATVLAVLIVPKLVSPPLVNIDGMLGNSFEQFSAMGAPLPQSPPAARNTRSMAGVLGDIADNDIELHQLGFGYRNAFVQLHGDASVQWRPWLESLPEKSVDCNLAANTEHCTAISTDIEKLGKWGLLNQLACQNPATYPATFWQHQTETRNALLQLSSIESATSIASILQSGTGSDATANCAIVNKLTGKLSE